MHILEQLLHESIKTASANLNDIHWKQCLFSDGFFFVSEALSKAYSAFSLKTFTKLRSFGWNSQKKSRPNSKTLWVRSGWRGGWDGHGWRKIETNEHLRKLILLKLIKHSRSATKSMTVTIRSLWCNPKTPTDKFMFVIVSTCEINVAWIKSQDLILEFSKI